MTQLTYLLQTFDVKLLSVSSGLSQLGTMTTVRVAILKNDSPNGLFRFSQSEVFKQYHLWSLLFPNRLFGHRYIYISPIIMILLEIVPLTSL